ncbi:unnamed protein product [Rotaria sp. Silwood1]|nr:unnamed protein product [Rotaria sp. Silwood1]
MSKLSLLKADSEVLAHLDECEKEFLRYQLFIHILSTLSQPIDIRSQLIKFINVDSRSFINIELGQNINELFKKHDFRTILKPNSQLIYTDQEIRSLPSEILSSSITVYRAQLISNDDLEMMQKNPNALLSIYSFIIASKSYPSVIKICRRAVDNGLTVVLFEIKLFKKTSVNKIPSDPDILVFPLGIVLRLKSIESTPDNVWHIQADLINFNMQHFKDQLEFKTGKTFTSSTIDDYWTALDQLGKSNEEAKNTTLRCTLA